MCRECDKALEGSAMGKIHFGSTQNGVWHHKLELAKSL